MELARNDAAYDGRETGSGGKHFHAFSCIFMYFHVCAIRSMQFLRILNISMHFETFSCNTKMDERSQRRACKHFHAISKMTQGHTPE